MTNTSEGEASRRLGQYEIIREIGRGGMAVVYEAEHVGLKKRVAIKMLHSNSSGDSHAEARFVREGRAAARVRHLHVVEVFDVGIDDGAPFLVMELLEGQTLADLIRERGALPIDSVVQIFLPVISAVAAAHDVGLVHRDLKPSNVMLTLQNKTTLHPVVVDFGISKAADDDEALTHSGTVLGTVHYLAPEQARGAKFASPLSDQYSLGVMLYECVTGQRPFAGEGQYALLHAIVTAEARPVEALNPSLPPDFAALIRRAMRRSPELRFSSLRELGQALLAFASPVERARFGAEFERTAAVPEPTIESETALPLAVREPVAVEGVGVSHTVSRLPPRVSARRNLALGLVAGAAVTALGFAWHRQGRDAASSPPPARDAASVAAATSLAPVPPPVLSQTEPRVAASAAAPAMSSASPALRAPVVFAPNRVAPPRRKATSHSAVAEKGTNDAPIVE